MANLILHNVPDDLYDRLKETAAEHHRSITQEAIAMLKDALVPVSKTVTEDYGNAVRNKTKLSGSHRIFRRRKMTTVKK